VTQICVISRGEWAGRAEGCGGRGREQVRGTAVRGEMNDRRSRDSKDARRSKSIKSQI
jgi:hypothetical protein